MRLLAVLVALGCLGVTGASARSTGLGILKVGHFDSPVYATSTPSEPGKLYVVEQAGRIMVRGSATPFLDIRSIVKSGGEQGLLSMAFDPAYATNHRFYVDYTDVNGDTQSRSLPLRRHDRRSADGQAPALRQGLRVEPQRRPVAVRPGRSSLLGER